MNRYEAQLAANELRDTARLARETQLNALREEWRSWIEGLPTEEQLSNELLKSSAYRGALLRCMRIASGETGASDKVQVKACEAIFRLATEESRLAAEMRGDTTPQAQVQANVVQLPAAALEQFGEQLTEVLQMRRKAARGA